MRCIHCLAEIKDSAQFCSRCGQKQVQPEVQKLVCSSCGEELSGSSVRFCPICGAPQRLVAYCPNCFASDVRTVLEPGANYCAVCGYNQVPKRVDLQTYQSTLSSQLSWAQRKAVRAYKLDDYSVVGDSNSYPLLLWNGLLVNISSSTINVFNVKATEHGNLRARAFTLRDGSLPKISCSSGIRREFGYSWPTLCKVAGGCLVVPCYDRLFVWSLLENTMERQGRTALGGMSGLELELGGELCADIATDGQRFVAVLVKRGVALDLKVYEFDGDALQPYCAWERVPLCGQEYHLYCTAHSVYVGVQPDSEENGDIFCYSLDSGRLIPLPWAGRYRYMYSSDNRQDLFKVQCDDGFCEVYRLSATQFLPLKLLEKVVIPSTYRRDGQSYWIAGRSLHFHDGTSSVCVVPDLDGNKMKMSLPPWRAGGALLYVSADGLLCRLARQGEAICSEEIAVCCDGQELRLDALKTWEVQGQVMYGFASVGLVAVELDDVQGA